MLNPRYIAIFMAVLMLLSVVPATAWAVCTQGGHPGPVPMYYPGEMCMRVGCCPGPCMCIPNVTTWGHFQKGWRQWPGDKTRVDDRFPDSLHREVMGTPKGNKPEPLPEEEYLAPPQPETGPGINIREGAPTTPIDTPAPFDFGGGLPGLDLPPEGPGPEQPPAENAPEEGGLPGLPGAPADDTVPPAPMPGENSALPNNALPTAPQAGPALESPKYALTGATEKEASAPIAPLPFEEEIPEDLLTSSPLVENEPPAPPTETTADTWTENLSGAETLQATAMNHKATAIPHEAEMTPAPLPQTELPLPTAQASDDPRSWKSRRDQTSPSATRPVDYKEPAETTIVALDGYCPVELVRNEQWIEGKPQWEVKYKGHTYKMSGPVQHRLFRENPEQYAPMLSGYDPVLAITGKGRVAGRTDACVIYQGRLLMFSSQKTVAQFRQDPKRFMANLRLLEK